MRSVITFITIFLLLAGIGFTADINLLSSESGLEMISNSGNEFTARNSMNQIQLFEVQTKAGVYQQMRIDGFGRTYDAGLPEIPVLGRLIEIPLDAEVEVEIISSIPEEYALDATGSSSKLIPAQPSLSKSSDPNQVPFSLEQSVYNSDSYFANEIVRVEEVGIMRGRRLGRLLISPVEYNPVSNTIRVHNNLEFQVRFTGGDYNRTKSVNEKYYSPVFESSFSHLFNYQPLQDKSNLTRYPVSYVILADPMFQDALQPLVAWKRKKGFQVIEAYKGDAAVGTTRESMAAYMQSLWDAATPENPAPTYLLIVGDNEQIPAFQNSHHTDLYFATFDGGSDYLPDLYYGRFSAQTVVQLQPQIDKTLEYEQFTMPDPSFLDEVVMVSGVDASYAPVHGNGQINYGTTYYFNLAHGITSHTYLYPESRTSAAAIISDVSNGAAYANYTAHGSPSGWADPSFSTSDVAGLTNAHKYPLMVGNACSTNEFQNAECFGEALLRAELKGAIGYIGGSNSTYWDEDYYWGVGYGPVSANPTYEQTGIGAYDGYFHENGEPQNQWYITQAQLMQAGNLAVTASGSNLTTYYWEIYHLMGDPSVSIYLTNPPEISASFMQSIPIGSSSLLVTAEPNALVALSFDGAQLDAAVTDESGSVILNFEPLSNVGDADLVITAQNRRPFITTVSVIPNNSAFVVYSQFTIGDAAGNSNGLADFGETIDMAMTLENLGQVAASGVNAVLRSSDTNITLLDSTEFFGDFDPAGSLSVTGAFQFTIADSITDQHKVTFSLVVTDADTGNWQSTFKLTLCAPVLETGSLTIDDYAGGNANGKLDPGETVILNFEAMNTGHSTCSPVMATLASASPYITIEASGFEVGDIPGSATETASFTVTVAAETPVGTPVDFIFAINGQNYGDEFTYVQSVGIQDETFESGDMSQYEWATGGDAAWTIVEGTSYDGDFSVQSGDITDNQSSELTITLEVLANGTLSFYKKVSSESGYDYLTFYLDGVQQGSWAGEIDWSREEINVSAGEHTFKWVYDKDGSVSNGSDCAWIDYVVFPPIDAGVINAGMLELVSPVSGDDLTDAEIVSVNIINVGTKAISNFPVGYRINGGRAISEAIEASILPGDTLLYSFTKTANLSAAGSYDFAVFLHIPGDISASNDSVFATIENTVVSGINETSAIPTVFALNENYPNPFNPETTIRYDVPQAAQVRMSIYNLLGQRVRMLMNDRVPAGYRTIIWNGRDDYGRAMPSGIYLLRMESDKFSATRKMVLLK